MKMNTNFLFLYLIKVINLLVEKNVKLINSLQINTKMFFDQAKDALLEKEMMKFISSIENEQP